VRTVGVEVAGRRSSGANKLLKCRTAQLIGNALPVCKAVEVW
jgi:hypothetical protein